MKKIVVTILSFLYLAATIGTTVHFHYCMDKLVDAGLWHSNDKICGNCGMEKSHEENNGCCKDEQIQVKLENDHKGILAYKLTDLDYTLHPVVLPELLHIHFPTVTKHNPLSNALLRSGGIAFYIRNCVFRI